MSYELILAQTVSLLYGSTLLNYTLIIGVFICSLGIGAAWHAWRGVQASRHTFWAIEALLAVIGCSGPFVILGVDYLFSATAPWMILPGSALVAGAIGFLSGMEIPVVIDLVKSEIPDELAASERIRLIIGLDFLGTFAAAATVPILLFPSVGLIRAVALTAFVNAGLALVIGLGLVERQKRSSWGAVTVMMVTLLVLAVLATKSSKISDAIFSAVY